MCTFTCYSISITYPSVDNCPEQVMSLWYGLKLFQGWSGEAFLMAFLKEFFKKNPKTFDPKLQGIVNWAQIHPPVIASAWALQFFFCRWHDWGGYWSILLGKNDLFFSFLFLSFRLLAFLSFCFFVDVMIEEAGGRLF